MTCGHMLNCSVVELDEDTADAKHSSTCLKSHSRKHFMLPCKMCTTFFKLNSIVTILLPAEPLRGYRKHTVKAPFTRTDNLVDSTVRLIVA